MKKICLLLLLTLFATLHSYDHEWENYKEKVLPSLYQIDGWCSREKAQHMMDLVYEINPQICVEIGVYGGSSIYPTACALAYQKSGVVYAIDPWSKDDCIQGFEVGNEHFEWWSQVDLEKIYFRFLSMLKQNNLNSYCLVMRMTSEEAYHHFEEESIDILHIDGNHSEDSALTDAKLYLPKVKKGGYIWFDDVHWASTTKAVEYLSKHCDVIKDRFVNNCVLFQKKI